MKLKLFLFITIIITISAMTAISFGQRTRDNDKPISGDFKITIRNTVGGRSTEGTTMIRGQRERSETNMNGMSMGTTITECDLKRTIQINDKARKYLITPMDSGDATEVSSGGVGNSSGAGPSRRGGVVTMTINTVDTGERKEMFGFTARHLRSTMISESSPDACQPQHMKMERDGWYINLEYGLNCGGNERPPQVGRMPAPGGCRDSYRFKHTGPSNLGYPLIETMTMYGADGTSVQFTSTKEVVEMSRQTLDAALFEVPAGYTEARSQQEMYAAPSMADIMATSRQQSGESSNSGQSSMSGTPSNTAARVRVGVMSLNNKTKTSVSIDSLREQLIAALNNDGLEAIALNASSPSEAMMEAKAKRCAYILSTDISTLKTASAGKKFGGMLGRATGVGSGDAGKSEARFDFSVLAAGGAVMTKSSASGSEDSQDASVRTAIEGEARAVAAAVPRP